MTEKRVLEKVSSAQGSTPFEDETADEGREAYTRGGPVRSDEPERDFFIEKNAQIEIDGSPPTAVPKRDNGVATGDSAMHGKR